MFIILNFSRGADKNELLAARTYLEQAALNNLPEFLKALSDVLVQQSNSAVARTASGLQLKNHLTSKDVTLSEQYRQRWLSFSVECREYIKKNVRIVKFVVSSKINLKLKHLDPWVAWHGEYETIIGCAVCCLCGCRGTARQPMELFGLDAGQQSGYGGFDRDASWGGARGNR